MTGTWLRRCKLGEPWRPVLEELGAHDRTWRGSGPVLQSRGGLRRSTPPSSGVQARGGSPPHRRSVPGSATRSSNRQRRGPRCAPGCGGAPGGCRCRARGGGSSLPRAGAARIRAPRPSALRRASLVMTRHFPSSVSSCATFTGSISSRPSAPASRYAPKRRLERSAQAAFGCSSSLPHAGPLRVGSAARRSSAGTGASTLGGGGPSTKVPAGRRSSYTRTAASIAVTGAAQ